MAFGRNVLFFSHIFGMFSINIVEKTFYGLIIFIIQQQQFTLSWILRSQVPLVMMTIITPFFWAASLNLDTRYSDLIFWLILNRFSQVMDQVGVQFESCAAGIDESKISKSDPKDLVLALSEAKSMKIRNVVFLYFALQSSS